jgi:hypothetical protein
MDSDFETRRGTMKKRGTYFVENWDTYFVGSGNKRFDVLDAHKERVKIKEKHPERPTLTAYALSILFPKTQKEDKK